MPDDRNLYSGLIRIHILHHAAKEPIYGLGMLEEMATTWLSNQSGHSVFVSSIELNQ